MELAGTQYVPDVNTLMQTCDIIFAAVPAIHALVAAQDAVPSLRRGTLYADASTATPAEKEEISQMVFRKGREIHRYRTHAAPLKLRHKVPMLISGNASTTLLKKRLPAISI
jgi:hypothetical protein